MDKIKQPPSMSGHVGIVGELVDFGRVKNDLGISDTPSYFLELRNNNGGTTTIWGQELYETLVKSNKQIGEMIQLNHLGKQLIEQHIAIRNKDGKVTHYENQTNWKNVWEIVEPNNTAEDHSLPVSQRDSGKKNNITNKLEQNSLSNLSEIMNYITNSELDKIGSINGQTQTVEQHKPFRHKKGLVYRTIRTSGTYGFSNQENSRSITPFEMRQIEIPTTLIDTHENKLVLRRLEFDEICHLGLGHTLCFPISGIKYRFDIAELQLYCNFDVDLQVLKAFDIQDKPVYLLKNMDLDVLRSSLNSPFRFVSSIAVRMLDVNVNTLKASLPDRIFNKDLNSSQKMDLLIGRSIEILNAELNTLSSEDLMVSAEPINRDILKLVYWRRNSPETRIDILSSDLEFLHENEQRKFLISEFQKIHFYINKISTETETQQVLSALDLLQDQEYIAKATNNIVFQMPEFNTLGLEEQMELFPDFANSIALPLTKEDKSRLLSIGTLELDGV